MEPRDLSANTVYRAGRGVEEVARELGVDSEDLLKLASNENMYGPSPRAVEAIEASARRMHSYPKASNADLVAAVAERWDLDRSRVWLAPGADGAIDYLSRAMLAPADGVLVPDPGFAYYPMSTRYHHGSVREYSLSKHEEFAQTPETVLSAYEGERIVYVTSPHNPTGSELTVAEVATLAAETGEETLVVVDEAYGEFSDAPSARTLLDQRDDVAVLRTFSKAYGLAGVRLGYALVPPDWADAYARINTPFAASELACRAGLAALEDREHVERTVETAAWAREYYRAELACRTWPSGANFVLCDVGGATAVAEAAEREGVIVRDCSSFGLPGCVRLTCGTETEARRAVDVLNGVIAE
jgi:histidinol-phosphate aminotransferase